MPHKLRLRVVSLAQNQALLHCEYQRGPEDGDEMGSWALPSLRGKLQRHGVVGHGFPHHFEVAAKLLRGKPARLGRCSNLAWVGQPMAYACVIF